jgi:hypothetical protein
MKVIIHESAGSLRRLSVHPNFTAFRISSTSKKVSSPLDRAI